MDDLLPSYESVIRRDPWVLIAPYLSSQDLCAAALVSRKWHEVFNPNLWGSPASHFGEQNDTVYVALTRFKRTLPYVRPSVRELTHTLHFPPAHAELYEGPHAEWLRDCLEYLPRLQCLIVNGLPFFDHACLLSLRYPSLRWKSTRPNASFPVFSLRLLDASGCTNATSTGLAEALPHFPDLVSLDLSRTQAAKEPEVLSKFRYLRNLRVLNVRGLGLRDAEFAVVAQAIGSRVRSLDISDNSLTDAAARLLLDHCLKEVVIQAHPYRGPLAPVEVDGSSSQLDMFETENLVSHLRKKLTRGFVGSLAIEGARDVGVTHLFLSRNAITVEGISGLLRSTRLQVLDAGILPSTLKGSVYEGSEDMQVELPSVSKLTQVLARFASPKLEYLRLNYQVVTEDAPIETVATPPAELSGDLGLYAPPNAQELEAFEPLTPELDAESTTVIELPTDSSFPAELPAPSPPQRDCDSDHFHMGDTTKSTQSPLIYITPEPQLTRRGSAFAPEPVSEHPELTPVSPLDQDSVSLRHPSDQQDSLSPLCAIPQPQSPNQRPRNNSSHISDRQSSISLRQSQEPRLHPSMLPNLHTLVLTSVPTSTANGEDIHRLTQFIADAAEESSIAKQRAKDTYILPPGRRRAVAEKEYARSVFALRRVVLEMEPPSAAAPRQRKENSWRAYPTKSSTEDKDSEAFWEAAKGDFSFFEEEECGQPSTPSHLMAPAGLEVAPQSRPSPLQPLFQGNEEKPLQIYDVVAEIGKFRRERKAAFEQFVQMGEGEPEVEGYWDGDITVFRGAVGDEEGEEDWYGNRYEGGWYYR